jgi:hypothetical protein
MTALPRSPLQRKSRLRAKSKKRAADHKGRIATLRAEQAEDSPCVARLEGCTRRATDAHEVKTRARGGSISDRLGQVLLCRHCHSAITGNPAWSDRHGWTLASWDDDWERAWRFRVFLRCPLTCPADHREDA